MIFSRGGGLLWLIPLLLLFLTTGCPEESTDGLPPKAMRKTRSFDFNEKILMKAITSILKEKGFDDPKVDWERGKVETDYFTDGNFRTKVEATVKTISRRESEVSLSVITEAKDKAEWKEKRMMEKEQYDRFFEEIEMQAYRELAKGE